MGIYTRNIVKTNEIDDIETHQDELEHVSTKSVNREELDFNPEKIEVIKKYTVDSMIIVLYPQDNIEDLEVMWANWNSMGSKHRKDSDMKCTEIYGMINKDLYEKNMSLLNNNHAVDRNIQREIDPEAKGIFENNIQIAADMMSGVINESTVTQKVNSDRRTRKREMLPMYTHEEVKSFGDKYGKSDMNIKEWKFLYEHQCNGLLSEEGDATLSKIWYRHMKEAYNDINELRGENLKNRKQSILELGWDPEVKFTLENVSLFTSRINTVLTEQFTTEIKDLSGFKIMDMVEESTANDITNNPVYIVLLKSDSMFGRLINKVTGSRYSHAAIGTDSDLSRLYSFNLDRGGFAIESIADYINQNSKSELAVYTIFLDNTSMRKLRLNLDEYINNRDNTSYGIKNLVSLMRQKTVALDSTLVCSQFVDLVLKKSGTDVTNKDSSLVIPKDFYKNKKMYKIYEGKTTDYSASEMERMLTPLMRRNKIKRYKVSNESSFIDVLRSPDLSLYELLALDKAKDVLSERSLSIYNEHVSDYIHEYKETPLKFNQDGDLIFHTNKDLNYEEEYNKAHRLLKVYSKDDNIDGTKYELARLWGVSNRIMDDVANGGDKSIYRTRARVLNDFNKYIQVVHKEDPGFNFITYFETTPFYNKGVIIDKNTVKYGTDLASNVARLLIRKY